MMTDTYQPGFSDLCGIACAIGEQEADAFLEEAGKRGSSERFLQSYAADFLGRVVYAQANTWAYREGFILLAIVFLAAMAPAWLMRFTREMSHVSPDSARL